MSKTRREPLPERTCANPSCRDEHGDRTVFVPDRSSQVFHSTPCRKDYWRQAVHYAPHACPLCTQIHDPEEAAILDALSFFVRTETFEENGAYGSGLVLVGQLNAFIARRREILATKPAAPA